MFQRQKSIDEMEEESEVLDTQIELKRKKLMLAELNKRGGEGFWKKFSFDGTKAGISFQKVKEWLSNNSKK